MQNFAISLWFDNNAKEAVRFYTGLFPARPSITWLATARRYRCARHGDDGQLSHARAGVPGDQRRTGVQLHPRHLLHRLLRDASRGRSLLASAGGRRARRGSAAGSSTATGVSWQIVPTALGELMSDPDPEKVRRADGGDAQDGQAGYRRAEEGVRGSVISLTAERSQGGNAPLLLTTTVPLQPFESHVYRVLQCWRPALFYARIRFKRSAVPDRASPSQVIFRNNSSGRESSSASGPEGGCGAAGAERSRLLLCDTGF